MCNNRVRRRNKTLSADEFYGSDSTWLSGLMPFKIIIAHVIRMNTIKHSNNAMLQVNASD